MNAIVRGPHRTVMNAKQRLYASIVGTIVVALCCFTPILVIVLTAVGVAAAVPYLDFVLLPALVVLVIVTWRSYRRYADARRRDA